MTTFLLIFLLHVSAPPSRHDGLSAALRTTNTTVPMGEPVWFELDLAFDSTTADPRTRAIDLFHSTVYFRFERLDSNGVYIRHPQTMNMLTSPTPGDFVNLEEPSILPQRFRVYLLARDGSHVPPGRYDVFGVFESKAPQKPWWNESRPSCYGDALRRPRTAGWKPWEGTIESSALRLTIEDVEQIPVSVAVPTRIVLEDGNRSDQFVYHFDKSSINSVYVARRPGFTLGYWSSYRREGEPPQDRTRGLRGTLGNAWLEYGLLIRYADHLRSGGTIVFDLVIFETSIPDEHLWMPERGDYRELWRGEIPAKLD